MSDKYEKYKENARIASDARRRAEGISRRGSVSAWKKQFVEPSMRKKTVCAICGAVVTVMNNLNFYKTPLCDSPACKRARKTELQRQRRLNGGS